MITIKSNGSNWAGGQPDSMEVLFELLETETLDPVYEEFHGYRAVSHLGGYSFSGNFFNLSHVFNIWVDEEDVHVIEKLESLAQQNMLRPEYECQAFSLFAEHAIVETPTGCVLLSKQDTEKLEGYILSPEAHAATWVQGSDRFLRFLGSDPSAAKIIGPRFSSAEVERLAA